LYVWGLVRPHQRSELRAKERELRDKDNLIASLQDDVARMQQTTRTPNWPRFLPLVYMSIANEIRDGARQRHMRFVYAYWICMALALEVYKHCGLSVCVSVYAPADVWGAVCLSVCLDFYCRAYACVVMWVC
jgi:hypothetical protein